MSNYPELYHHFATILEYPTPDLPLQVGECAAILASTHPGAAKRMLEFHEFLTQAPLSRIQEIYTYTFDLFGSCPPYVGHHLFGENHNRSLFMAKLNQNYAKTCFLPGNELPDHVAVILRYLSQGIESEFGLVLQNEGLKPALDQMLRLLPEVEGNPYRKVILALLSILNEPGQVGSKESPGAEEGGFVDG